VASPAVPLRPPEDEIAGLPERGPENWSRHSDSNRGPVVYETQAGRSARYRGVLLRLVAAHSPPSRLTACCSPLPSWLSPWLSDAILPVGYNVLQTPCLAKSRASWFTIKRRDAHGSAQPDELGSEPPRESAHMPHGRRTGSQHLKFRGMT
jgi:hypothetical protein